MKIVNILGGLGNQMFQYAFAYMLSIKNANEPVYIDTSLFNGYRLHNGFELEYIFGLRLPKAKWYQIAKVNWYMPIYKLSRGIRNLLPQRKTVYRNYMYMDFDENALCQDGDLYYDGYWQTSKYYKGYRQHILELFQFAPLEGKRNQEIAKLLKGNNTVGIHVRRGDYLNSPTYRGLCDKDYYIRAIYYAKKIIEKPVFFIFSNDMSWCKDNLKNIIGDCKVYYVDNNTGKESYRDMQLLTMAKCLIIANSSFSWWAAYLNNRNDKVVLCPPKWANNNRGEDIFEQEWIKI